MRAMMNRLSAPSKAARKIMDKLDLEVADAEGNLRDIPDILSDISTAMDGMGSAQQAAYLKELFGEVAGSGMAELIKQQGMGAFADLIEQLYSDVEGENRRMAMTRADNIEGDLKGLWSAWEEVGIGITDINEGPLRDLIQQITGIVREVGLWMQRNPELVATIAKVVAVVGILAAAGGALLVT